MKLSEKYFEKIKEESENSERDFYEEIKLYGEICKLEGMVDVCSNPLTFSNAVKAADKLQQIAKENEL